MTPAVVLFTLNIALSREGAILFERCASFDHSVKKTLSSPKKVTSMDIDFSLILFANNKSSSQPAVIYAYQLARVYINLKLNGYNMPLSLTDSFLSSQLGVYSPHPSSEAPKKNVLVLFLFFLNKGSSFMG